MANPKRKMPNHRTRQRRAMWKLEKPNFAECPQCHSMKMPHRVCPECGYYRDKEVVKA